MPPTSSSVLRQVTFSLLVLWLTAIVIHISLYPYLLSGPQSNSGNVILLWTFAPVIWWTAIIWLCEITMALYRDVVFFIVGSCVGTALGILGAVAFVDERKWGPLAWGLGALWAVTFVLTTIAIYFVCSHSTSNARPGEKRVGGDQSQNYESLEEGRSSEQTIVDEEEIEMQHQNEEGQDRESLINGLESE